MCMCMCVYACVCIHICTVYLFLCRCECRSKKLTDSSSISLCIINVHVCKKGLWAHTQRDLNVEMRGQLNGLCSLFSLLRGVQDQDSGHQVWVTSAVRTELIRRFSTLVFETDSVPDTEAHWLARWLARGSGNPIFSALELQVCRAVTSLYLEAGDLKSGPNACGKHSTNCAIITRPSSRDFIWQRHREGVSTWL